MLGLDSIQAALFSPREVYMAGVFTGGQDCISYGGMCMPWLAEIDRMGSRRLRWSGYFSNIAVI